MKLGKEGRITLRSALRNHADTEKALADHFGGAAIAEMPNADLIRLAGIVGIDVAATIGASPADTSMQLEADSADQSDNMSTDPEDALEAEVQRVLASSYTTMPAMIRDLVRRANKPVEVREIVKEIKIEVPVSVPVDSATGAHVPAPRQIIDYSTIKPVRKDDASRVFDNSTKLLKNCQVAVWNDPQAPQIDPLYEFDPATLRAVIGMDQLGRNVWLHGHKGTGKTSFGHQYAARQGRAFVQINFNRYTEGADLIGGMAIRSADQGGGTQWEDGALVAAMRRPGCVVLLDEPDFAKPGTLAFLQSILNERRVLIERTGEMVECAPGVTFIAAANTNGQGDDTGSYADRHIMDAAFLDRFSISIPMQFLPRADEIKIVHDRTGCPVSVAEKLVDYMRLTRERVNKEADITSPVSLRRILAWAENVWRVGLPVATAFDWSVLNFANRDEGEVLRQMYKATVDPKALQAVVDSERTGTKPGQADTTPAADTGDVL